MMNSVIFLEREDILDRTVDFLRLQFALTFGHQLEMYFDSRGRKKIRWCFHGEVKSEMWIRLDGFTVQSVDFQKKTIYMHVHSKLSDYIKDYKDKIYSLSNKLS